MMLTVDRLREVLDYSPDSGLFVWRAKTGRCSAGQIAGSLDTYGYVVIRVDRRMYKAARLAWLWMTGEWPRGTVDHKNCVRDDNRWANLREATYGQQNHNRPLTSLNKSGFKGVSRHTQNNRWVAHINNRYLGSFDTPEEAHEAYCEAAEQQFGEFFNKGR